MTKFWTAFSAAIVTTIFTIGCGGSHDPNTPPEKPGILVNGKICYSQACANTTAATDIFDNSKDYVYPDNANFPSKALSEQYRAPHSFLDLSSQSLRVKVAPDFMLNEFVQSEKGRYGIILPVAVKVAQAIRDALGGTIKITSGYRSPGYNSRVEGSAKWSRHTYGDAMDMQFSSLKKLEKECKKKNASFVLAYPAHIHCDWRETPLDLAFYPPSKEEGPAFLKLSRLYSSQMKIVHSDAINTDKLIINVLLPEELELEGTPLYRWKITTPNQETLYFDTAQVELPMAAKGNYNVEVVVGETLHTASTIKW
jgi:hypothetical protein